MAEDLDGWVAAPRCPECGEPGCLWWSQRRVHELASMGMGAARVFPDALRREGWTVDFHLRYRDDDRPDGA